MNHSKSYTEMSLLPSFDERFKYLKLNGQVGSDTFGFDRYMNQDFYRSAEWKHIRSYVIARDEGCDLGIPDCQINGRVFIHHINPISKEDVILGNEKLLDPENLVCISMDTHNALHYGDDSILNKNKIIERTPNDMCPWKR